MSAEQYVAHFWRYKLRDSEELDTLDEAVAYLANGWERAELAEIRIVGPDGSVVLDGDELFRRMKASLGA